MMIILSIWRQGKSNEWSNVLGTSWVEALIPALHR